MRSAIFLGLLLGCGNDVGLSPDATVPAAPRVIAGGGIGDGPITGVVNLHVIDDVTRRPIPNATVRVGTVTGATDASGLFVARGVTGPQTIVAKANSYRPDVWVGVDGANVTINLQAANPSPPTGTVTGTITSFDSLPVPAGHVRVAIASYSQLDTLGDEDNNLAQPNNQNICLGSTCSFTLTSRTGRVAVLAAIFDTDLHGTPFDLTDDTSTLLGWAVQTDVMVTANGTHTVTLGIVPATALQDVTVSFGSPPSGLAEVGALVGIDTPDGVLQLTPVFPTPAAPTLRAPKPQAIAPGATYRLTGFATNGATAPATSLVLRRGLTGTQLAAGSWLAPPTGTPTRTGATWTTPAGATVFALAYAQGATKVLGVSVFDGSTSVTVPDLIAVPSGPLTVTLEAIGAPGLDVTSFSLDADRAKLATVASQTMQVN